MILAQPCESETQEPEVCINLLYTVHTPPPPPPLLKEKINIEQSMIYSK